MNTCRSVAVIKPNKSLVAVFMQRWCSVSSVGTEQLGGFYLHLSLEQGSSMANVVRLLLLLVFISCTDDFCVIETTSC